MRRLIRRLAYVAVPVLALTLPAGVAAFPLTDCTATLTSYDSAGTVIGTATSGAVDATQAHPLLLDPDGTVGYDGTSGSIVFTDFTWSVNLFGMFGGLEGHGTNETGGTAATGSIAVSDALPFPVIGTFYVTGSVSDSANSCDGSGWIEIEGDVFATPQFWAGVLLSVLGLIALLGALRGRFWLGLLGGLLAGIGIAILLITYGWLFVGEWTPAIVVAVLLIGGPLVALLRRPTTPPTETPPTETPPTETPPASTPPASPPPMETPPMETPPVETATTETPPTETPPASDDVA